MTDGSGIGIEEVAKPKTPAFVRPPIVTKREGLFRQTERVPLDHIDEVVVAQIVEANFYSSEAYNSGGSQKPFDTTGILNKMGYVGKEYDDYQAKFPAEYLAVSTILYALSNPEDPARPAEKALERIIKDKPNLRHETVFYRIKSLTVLSEFAQGLRPLTPPA